MKYARNSRAAEMTAKMMRTTRKVKRYNVELVLTDISDGLEARPAICRTHLPPPFGLPTQFTGSVLVDCDDEEDAEAVVDDIVIVWKMDLAVRCNQMYYTNLLV
jgi:hypothetical protein